MEAAIYNKKAASLAEHATLLPVNLCYFILFSIRISDGYQSHSLLSCNYTITCGNHSQNSTRKEREKKMCPDPLSVHERETKKRRGKKKIKRKKKKRRKEREKKKKRKKKKRKQ